MIRVRCCHADEEASHSSQVISIRPLDWLGAMEGIEPFPLWGSKFVGRGLENHITGHSHYLFIAPGLDPSATKRSGETSDWARERPREFVVPSSCALLLPFHRCRPRHSLSFLSPSSPSPDLCEAAYWY